MKTQLLPFRKGPLCLRLIEEVDLELTLSWRNRDDARIWFKNSNPFSFSQHRAWFQRYQDKDDDFLFIVEFDGRPVGQAAIFDIQWETGIAEIGRFLVAPEASGKGYIHWASDALI